MQIILYILLVVTPSLALGQESEELIQVKKGDYFFLDAPDNNLFPVRTFKDHFHAKWLEAWQHVVKSQDLEKSLNLCMAAMNDENQEAPCLDAGNFFDGAGRDALWKPTGDPKASCAGRAVPLLPAKYLPLMNEPRTSASNVEVLDKDFNKIGSGVYRGPTNGNRPTFCMDKAGSSYGPGPIQFKYTLNNGVTECRTVRNPSNRED